MDDFGATDTVMVGRPRRTDEQNVTNKIVAARLTPREEAALRELVALEQADMDKAQTPIVVSESFVIRKLIREKAEAREVWPAEVTDIPPRRQTEAPAKKAKALKSSKTPRTTKPRKPQRSR